MENSIESALGIAFPGKIVCQCQEWLIGERDERDMLPTNEYRILHSCPELEVYQKKMSLVRLFLKK